MSSTSLAVRLKSSKPLDPRQDAERRRQLEAAARLRIDKERERIRSRNRRMLQTHLYDDEAKLLRVWAAEMNETVVAVTTAIIRHALSDKEYVRSLLKDTPGAR